MHHREADASHDDQPAHGEIQEQVAAVTNHAVRKKGKTCVAKGGNGMEYREKGSLGRRKFATPVEIEKK